MKKRGGEEAQPNSPTSNQLKSNSTTLQLFRDENIIEHYRALYENLTESGLDKEQIQERKSLKWWSVY